MSWDRMLKLLPPAGTLLCLLLLLWLFQARNVPPDWSSVVGLVVIAAFTFAVAAALRYAARASEMRSAEYSLAQLRGTLAPLVIGIGTVGILVVGGAVLWGITLIEGPEAVDPSVYLGVFSSVVPVFATWVGAVIAFFFSNESFRQAALASGAAAADPAESEPVTSPTRMIPFAKITTITLGGPVRRPDHVKETKVGEPTVGATPTPPADASAVYPTDINEVRISQVVWMFNDTVSRIVVLDKDQRVRAVLRDRLVPGHSNTDTLRTYFEFDNNKADSENFKFLPETATVGDARALRRIFGVSDIFVTKTGSRDEPIKGWLPDDKLL